MLPVFEQDVKNAFATVLNRLAAEPSILDIDDDGAEREKLDAQLQSVKRRQSLLHDRALADRYTAELREKKAALDSEEKTILDALAKLEKAVVGRFSPLNYCSKEAVEKEILRLKGVN